MYTPSSLEMLDRLIAFQPVSDRSNLGLIGFVRDYLDGHGIPYRLSFNAEGTKANLHATIGPVGPGGLALSGHVDVVPVSDQVWTGDPFRLRRQDGRLIGRGTCDMLGFVASMLAAAPAIQALQPRRPVHMLLTYDEEVGYLGVRRLVSDFAESGLKPDWCVVGEASSMVPVIGQKGRFIASVQVRGRGAHGSRSHLGVNAVHAAARVISWLVRRSAWLESQGPTAAGYDPPWTQLLVNDLIADNLSNSVPHRAAFNAEWRSVPGHKPADDLATLMEHVRRHIEPDMRRRSAEAGFEYDVLLDLPAVSLPDEHVLIRAALAAAGVAAGRKASFCSESAIYAPADIGCIVCGPGELAQVHQPDEWIEESQLAACDTFVRNLAGHFVQ